MSSSSSSSKKPKKSVVLSDDETEKKKQNDTEEESEPEGEDESEEEDKSSDEDEEEETEDEKEEEKVEEVKKPTKARKRIALVEDEAEHRKKYKNDKGKVVKDNISPDDDESELARIEKDEETNHSDFRDDSDIRVSELKMKRKFEAQKQEDDAEDDKEGAKIVENAVKKAMQEAKEKVHRDLELARQKKEAEKKAKEESEKIRLLLGREKVEKKPITGQKTKFANYDNEDEEDALAIDSTLSRVSKANADAVKDAVKKVDLPSSSAKVSAGDLKANGGKLMQVPITDSIAKIAKDTETNFTGVSSKEKAKPKEKPKEKPKPKPEPTAPATPVFGTQFTHNGSVYMLTSIAKDAPVSTLAPKSEEDRVAWMKKQAFSSFSTCVYLGKEFKDQTTGADQSKLRQVIISVPGDPRTFSLDQNKSLPVGMRWTSEAEADSDKGVRFFYCLVDPTGRQKPVPLLTGAGKFSWMLEPKKEQKDQDDEKKKKRRAPFTALNMKNYHVDATNEGKKGKRGSQVRRPWTQYNLETNLFNLVVGTEPYVRLITHPQAAQKSFEKYWNKKEADERKKARDASIKADPDVKEDDDGGDEETEDEKEEVEEKKPKEKPKEQPKKLEKKTEEAIHAATAMAIESAADLVKQQQKKRKADPKAEAKKEEEHAGNANKSPRLDEKTIEEVVEKAVDRAVDKVLGGFVVDTRDCFKQLLQGNLTCIQTLQDLKDQYGNLNYTVRELILSKNNDSKKSVHFVDDVKSGTLDAAPPKKLNGLAHKPVSLSLTTVLREDTQAMNDIISENLSLTAVKSKSTTVVEEALERAHAADLEAEAEMIAVNDDDDQKSANDDDQLWMK